MGKNTHALKTDRHHTVPKSHLKEYASSGGELFMFDRRRGTTAKANAKTVARENHYYTIEGHSDSRKAENVLAALESEAAAAVSAIMTPTPRPPTSDEAAAIIIRAAVQVTRVPAYRDRLVEMHRDAARDRQMIERAHGIDRPIVPDPTRNELIGHTFVGAAEMIDVLRPRSWTLFVVSGTTELITSDNPVVLFPKKGTYPGPGGMGFGLANTVVVIPLTRRALLLGDWEIGTAERPMEISRRAAAAFNSAIARGSYRFIFSPSRAFRFIDPETGAESTDVVRWKRSEPTTPPTE